MSTEPRVHIYTVPGCGYCVRAKQLLDTRGIPYIEHDARADESALERLRAATTRRTFPQIFIDGQGIGGCDDLHDLDAAGELAHLIAE